VISWTQRFEIKFHTCVHHTGGGVGECFQLRVVGGNETGDTFVRQVQEDGTRQGGTFLRIGTGAQFIQQHQRFGACFLQDPHNVGNMSGKGREGLFNGLLIANVSKNVIEKA